MLHFVDCQLICFNFLIFLFFSSNFQYSLDAATCSEAPVCIEVNIHIKIKRLTCFCLSVLEVIYKNKQATRPQLEIGDRIHAVLLLDHVLGYAFL